MTYRERDTIRKSIDKAQTQLTEAKSLFESSYGRRQYSDAIGSAQVCIELSVKGLLALLGVKAGRTHGKGKDWLKSVTDQIIERGLLERLEAQDLHYEIRLPRLMFLMNHWAEIYLEAKYGYGAELGYLAPAEELFESRDVENAIAAAEECQRASSRLKYLQDSDLDTLIA